MPDDVVVDTSIIAKLVFAEPDSDVVRAWFDRGNILHCPDYLLTELTSVAVKKARFHGLGLAQAESALAAAETMIDAISPNDRLAAMKIAVATTASLYDSLFLALADNLGLALVTADDALVKRLRQAQWAGALIDLDSLRASAGAGP